MSVRKRPRPRSAGLMLAEIDKLSTSSACVLDFDAEFRCLLHRAKKGGEQQKKMRQPSDRIRHTVSPDSKISRVH